MLAYLRLLASLASFVSWFVNWMTKMRLRKEAREEITKEIREKEAKIGEIADKIAAEPRPPGDASKRLRDGSF